MIIRQTLNFAVHLAGGIAFGMLAVTALGACASRQSKEMRSKEWTPVEPAGSPEAMPEPAEG